MGMVNGNPTFRGVFRQSRSNNHTRAKLSHPGCLPFSGERRSGCSRSNKHGPQNVPGEVIGQDREKNAKQSFGGFAGNVCGVEIFVTEDDF